MAFTYNSDGYNADSYFLAAEEDFSAAPKAVSTSVGAVNSSLVLLSQAVTVNAVAATLAGTVNLAANSAGSSVVVSNLRLGFSYNTDLYNLDGYFLECEQTFGATPKVVSTSVGAVNSSLSLLSNSVVTNSLVGGVYSTTDLLSNAQVNTVLVGDVYSKMGLFSYSHSQSLSVARLTFPSLYVGDLDIISLTPIQDISSLTPINYIGLFH